MKCLVSLQLTVNAQLTDVPSARPLILHACQKPCNRGPRLQKNLRGTLVILLPDILLVFIKAYELLIYHPIID